MIDAFDFWDNNARLEFKKEDVRVYRINNDQYLFVGQILYASTPETRWYVKNVLPHAKGKVLEVGLGLGCASKVILSSPKVSHLLTIEKNSSVVEAFGKPLPRHNILLADIYDWAENVPKEFKLFDLIFVDHYTLEDEDTILELKKLRADLVPLVKPGGKIIFWVEENAAEEDKESVRNLWLI